MSEFVINVVKGVYPIYFGLFLVGVIHRVKCRQWRSFDTLLAASFGGFFLLSVCQVPLFYGFLETSKRYLWIGLPLYLPFAAEGVLWLQSCFRKKRLAAIFWLLLIGVNLYNACSPIIHERCSVRKKAARRISRAAAAWIRYDWSGASLPPVAVFKCDHYQSGKRPLVQSDFACVGYLCGGQNYPAFFLWRNVLPDYVVCRSSEEKNGYILMKVLGSVSIYKRRESRP